MAAGCPPIPPDLLPRDDRETVTFAAVTDPAVDRRDIEEMEARGELSAMYVPIIFEDEVIGVIANVATRRVRRFSRDDERLALNVATKAGIAINNAAAVTQLRRQNQELRLLLETKLGGHAEHGAADHTERDRRVPDDAPRCVLVKRLRV